MTCGMTVNRCGTTQAFRATHIKPASSPVEAGHADATVLCHVHLQFADCQQQILRAPLMQSNANPKQPVLDACKLLQY